MNGICSYSFVAAALIALGIGSIRARRWAWAINLILSWAWLIVGVVATIAITIFMPKMFAAGFQQAAARTPNAGPMPTGIVAVVLTFIIVFFAVFFVVVPIAFLAFFSRKDVEETCKRRDPVERWTDRCPLPVLPVSLLFGCGAVAYLLLAVTTPVVPFFGRYLTGAAGAVALLIVTGIETFLAVSIYRLRLAGWWIAVSALTLRLISAILTFRHADLWQTYSKMGWSDAQVQQISADPAFGKGFVVLWWWSAIFMVLFLGYMVWIKRYFRGSATPGAAEQEMPYLPSSGGSAL